MKKILNLTEVADYLGIEKRTLYRMIQDKRFPVEHIKGTKPRLWAIEAIEQWRTNGGEMRA